MRRVLLVVCLYGFCCEVKAMSPMVLEADPCAKFLYETWTVRVHQVSGGHTPSDAELLAPVGMQFTLTPAPSIKVLKGANGRSSEELQEFWSSFNGDLECNVSYKEGVTFHRLEGRGTVGFDGEHSHPHYFTMIVQTCDLGKKLFTSWITDERPSLAATPATGSSSLCEGEGVHPSFEGGGAAKSHNGRIHGTGG